MEGLEISDLKLSKLENELTIGAEFYSKQFINVVSKIKNSNISFDTLNNITDLITDGDHGTTKYQDKGILYLLSESIKEGYIDLSVGTRYISEKLNDSLKRSELKKGDVVVTKTGVYFGKSAVIPNEIKVANTSAHVAKITPKKNINSYYLSTFLNSSFGYSQLRRRGIKVSRPEIKLIEFKDILISIPSNNFQHEIEKIILNGQKILYNSKKVYREAENLLLKKIGLENFTPSTEGINIKTFSNSFATTGRLDAEYYQPKYEDYEQLIKKDKYSYIKDEYIHINKKSKKEEDGYNYIEISDVNVGDGSSVSNYIKTEELPANAKILIKKGDLLISNVRPYRGAVTIVNSEFNNLIVSSAFTVLRRNVKSIYNVEVLKVLLRTDLYKDWLLKFNVGTSYPVIKDYDVLNIPIPYINENKQKEIAALVEESFALKKQSEHLLETAKRAVEIAIEKNEEAALLYIEKETA